MANDYNYLPGQLNPLNFGPGTSFRRDVITDDSLSVYRNSMANMLSPNIFTGVTEFQAVVLHPLSVNAEDTPLFQLVRESLGLSLPPINHYICLIPELHAHLVNPAFLTDIEEKIQWLIRYPVFTVNPASLISTHVSLINAGSLVKVKFTDASYRYGEVTDIVMLNADKQDLFSYESSSSRDAFNNAAYGPASTMANPPGPLTDIDEKDYLFPIMEESRPSKGLSSVYGPRTNPIRGGARSNEEIQFHYGVDVGVPIGTPIVAPCDGNITMINPNSATGGRLMYLKETDPLIKSASKDHRQFEFFHLDTFVATKGQDVKRGDIIAYSGNTGPSTGPHLHFAVREGGSYGVGKLLDPMSFYPNIGTSEVTEDDLLASNGTSPDPMATEPNSSHDDPYGTSAGV
jgi:murein DD-endopeptidase MepM/ murein hydrolase activator NlpD